MIKKALIISLFLALGINCFAQRETTLNLPKFDHRFMHFGFLLGFNQANFVVERFPATVAGSDSLFILEPKTAAGFNLGIISALHFSEHFSLRFTPNLAFSSRSLEYTFETIEGPRKYDKIVESTLINFPLGIKYKSRRVNNFSAYILAGAAYTLDLASNSKSENLTTNLDELIIKIKRDDIVGEIGFGTDFYLEYFKFGIELKMSYGIKDLLEHDNTPLSDPIDKLSSKMFMLSLTFEG